MSIGLIDIFMIMIIFITIFIIIIKYNNEIIYKIYPNYNKYNLDFEKNGFKIFKNLFSENELNFIHKSISDIEKNYQSITTFRFNNQMIENIDRYSTNLSEQLPFIDNSKIEIREISVGKITDHYLHDKRFNHNLDINKFININNFKKYNFNINN